MTRESIQTVTLALAMLGVAIAAVGGIFLVLAENKDCLSLRSELDLTCELLADSQSQQAVMLLALGGAVLVASLLTGTAVANKKSGVHAAGESDG